MIFQGVGIDEPIRQGDVFTAIPRCELSLRRFMLLEPHDAELMRTVELSWQDVIAPDVSGREIAASITVVPTMGIVVSQDCDVARDESISFCEIVSLNEMLDEVGKYKEPKQWASLAKKHFDNPKWLYLPVDSSLGINERSAVDFGSIFQLDAGDARAFIQSRVCRLNDYAFQHFREKVANYFRRHAVDRWYPLTREELDAYNEKLPVEEAAKPFDWQQ